MDVIDSKTSREIADSVLAEVAKAGNELRCARNDIDKAQSRIKFVTLLTHKLIERLETKR